MQAMRVHVHYDPQVQRFWADSPDLDGLAVEAGTRAELQQEAVWAAETLLELAGRPGAPQLVFVDSDQA
jgi:predicted RNase H-like HicB family nuclease